MTADQTPVETATEAVSQPIPNINRLSHHEIQQWLARTALASLAQHRDGFALALAVADAGTNGPLIAQAWPTYPDTHPVKAYWLGQADAALAYLTGGAR